MNNLDVISTLIEGAIAYSLIYHTLVWSNDAQSLSTVRGTLVLVATAAGLMLLPSGHLKQFPALVHPAFWVLGIVIFQPEIRRAIDRIGRGQWAPPPRSAREDIRGASLIKHILRATEMLSREKIGGLIVIEGTEPLIDIVESGVTVNAQVTAELLANLFWPKSPTHDGAVIIRYNKIIAAGCLLPLTETSIADRRLGTRHRAAIGLSEKSDSVIIVVSEETGIISLAESGNLTRFLSKSALEARMFELYRVAKPAAHPVERGFKWTRT